MLQFCTPARDLNEVTSKQLICIFPENQSNLQKFEEEMILSPKKYLVVFKQRYCCCYYQWRHFSIKACRECRFAKVCSSDIIRLMGTEGRSRGIKEYLRSWI